MTIQNLTNYLSINEKSIIGGHQLANFSSELDSSGPELSYIQSYVSRTLDPDKTPVQIPNVGNIETVVISDLNLATICKARMVTPINSDSSAVRIDCEFDSRIIDNAFYSDDPVPISGNIISINTIIDRFETKISTGGETLYVNLADASDEDYWLWDGTEDKATIGTSKRIPEITFRITRAVHNTANFFLDASLLIGKIGSDTYALWGAEADHWLFSSMSISSGVNPYGDPVDFAELVFVYRNESWNKIYNPKTNTFVKIVDKTDTSKTLYESFTINELKDLLEDN